MKRSQLALLARRLCAVAGIAACRSATSAPPAAGEVRPAEHAAGVHAMAETTATAMGVPDSARRGYSAADVAFMQHMIGHHGQALTMSALVPERSRSESVRTLAERITISQRDEMAMMRRWLEARHETVPMEGMEHMHQAAHMPGMMPGMHDMHAMHGETGGESHLMPGMLTAEEMARLAAARGPEFDRLFLEDMIRHHEGALTMVASLFASTGAAQEPELFRLASDVDADQRAEIARMRALLASMTSPQ